MLAQFQQYTNLDKMKTKKLGYLSRKEQTNKTKVRKIKKRGLQHIEQVERKCKAFHYQCNTRLTLNQSWVDLPKKRRGEGGSEQGREEREKRRNQSRERKYGLQCLPGRGKDEQPGMPKCRKKKKKKWTPQPLFSMCNNP